MFYYQLLLIMWLIEYFFIFCLENGGLPPVGRKWIGLDVGQNVDSPRGLDWVSKLLDWLRLVLEN